MMLLKLACWIAKKHGFILIKSKVPNYLGNEILLVEWVKAEIIHSYYDSPKIRMEGELPTVDLRK
ncbi:hypothetical protein [Klebsiella pneumoniae]|uniref:hypothetical protein n=2 Tax=Bacteria TaxID=2 RepID=UPI0011E633F8|nr:hypothetical protein [Klebsiella pneumoniae]